jgi:hypothetical protein
VDVVKIRQMTDVDEAGICEHVLVITGTIAVAILVGLERKEMGPGACGTFRLCSAPVRHGQKVAQRLRTQGSWW